MGCIGCCGGGSPCCCCFQSINVLFKKNGVTIKTIEIPIESLVFEEITVGGGPGTRCTYNTSHLTTCPAGRNETGYVDIIPLMERSFSADYCQAFAPNTIYFNGVEVWKANYVVRSITLTLTCSATQKRLSIYVDGFYELIKYAESGTYQIIRQSDCAVIVEDIFSGVNVATAACSYQSNAVLPECVNTNTVDVRNPYLFFSARRQADLSYDTSLITATCQELVDNLASFPLWLTEYSSSTLDLQNCSMPTKVRSNVTFACDCGRTAKEYDFQWRPNVDIEDELVLIVPEITLC